MPETLKYGYVSKLCEVFELLINQIPHHIVVFCVIDALTLYEDSRTVCERASLAVQALVDVVERTKENGCTFQLLLTSPSNSRMLYRDMADREADVVWMPAEVPAQGGFTAMKWSDGVDSNLAATTS